MNLECDKELLVGGHCLPASIILMRTVGWPLKKGKSSNLVAIDEQRVALKRERERESLFTNSNQS